jgi:hypothetical protein
VIDEYRAIGCLTCLLSGVVMFVVVWGILIAVALLANLGS